MGHLGIFLLQLKKIYILKKNKNQLPFIFAFLYLFILLFLFGFYLAKLFLKTNKKEERLNIFIKDTTHELNTPISAILMSTESTNLI